MTEQPPSKDQLPQAMPSSESPVTQQEIVSAIHHHARELARLTATWPVHEPASARRCNHAFDVLVITTAYESGFGHGQQKDQLANPYSEGSYEHHAYSMGYEEGKRRAAQPLGSHRYTPDVNAPNGEYCRCICGKTETECRSSQPPGAGQ